MKKMKLIKSKKMLTVLLTATAAMAVTPMAGYADVKVAVQADEAAEVILSGNCGKGATDDEVTDAAQWNLVQNGVNENGEVTYTLRISGNGDVQNFKHIGDYSTTSGAWNSCNDVITEIVIEDGITSVGNYTFGKMQAVEKITIGKDFASYGNWAFHLLSSLKEIEVSSENENFKVGKDGALYSKDGKTLYLYPQGSMPDDFDYVIPDGVEIIHDAAFKGAEKITSLKIPAGVKKLGNQAFLGTSITNIYVPDTVTDVSPDVFSSSPELTDAEYDAPVLGTQVFRECPKLTTITIGEHVTTAGNTPFRNSNNLKNIILKTQTSSGNGYWFATNSSKDVTLYIDSTCTFVPTGIMRDFTGLKNVILLDGENEVSIGDRAFLNCTSLENVKNTERIKSVGESAFQNTNLTGTLELGPTVEKISAASFIGTQIEKLVISGSCEIGSLGDGGGAFAGLTTLKAAKLENVSKISNGVFRNCSELVAVDLTRAAKELEVGNRHTFTNMALGSCIYLGDPDHAKQFLNQNTITYTSNNTFVAVTNGGIFAEDTEYEAGKLATPIKSGYAFVGWYDNADFSGDAIETPENGKMYYAKWEKSKNYSVIQKKLDFGTAAYNDEVEEKQIVATSSDADVKPRIMEASSSDAVFAVTITDDDVVTVTPDTEAEIGKHTANIYIKMDDGTVFIVPVTMTIKKAIPEYTEIGELTAVEGDTLADVELPTGFTWQDPLTTSVGKAGERKFKVTYTPDDTEHYETIKDITVTITINQKWLDLNMVPVITAKDQTLTVGDTFDPLKGVTATDTEDGDLTAKIEVFSNTVDTTKAGTYQVIYKVTDNDGATGYKIITVTVNPKAEALNAIPTITAEDVTLTVGDTFDAKKNVTAADKEDGNLTAKIEIIANDVDTTKAGTYHVTYKVTDSQGASATKTITVTVKAKANTNSSSSSSDSDDGGEPASSTTKKSSQVSASTLEGSWKRNEKGWWFEWKNGSYPKSCWALLGWSGQQRWYHFDENGYMQTGWIKDNGTWYYLHPQADGNCGYMYTGWHLIDGKWYYFSEGMKQPQGAMLANTTTPDGYEVGPDGAWTGK